MAEQPAQGLAALQNNTLYFIVSYAVQTQFEEFTWGILAIGGPNYSELWQPTKMGHFQVVYQNPSNIAASATFLAAQKVGDLTDASLVEVRRVIAAQGDRTLLGLDSRIWVSEVAMELDKPHIVPFTRSIHQIQQRLISAGRSCKDRVATATGPPVIINT